MKLVWTTATRAAILSACLLTTTAAAPRAAQQTQPQAPPTPAKTYEPTSGQAGKDVVWVPTPPELVEKMLDMVSVSNSL